MSIKIKVNKLINKLHAEGGCGSKPDTYGAGWDDAIDRAIEIVEEMAEEAIETKFERKKAEAVLKVGRIKDEDPEVIPIQNTLVSELCPECDTEITVSWDVDTDGFEIFCPNCGKPMVLCSACHDREDEEDGCYCMWDDDQQSCPRMKNYKKRDEEE